MPQDSRGTVLATLLFTDMVGSSELADQLGDRRWRELLARHHAIVRRELKHFNGRELDTAGDGFFAAFTKPAEAVRAAAAIVDGVRALGIEIRAGLHMGEAETFGAKLSGVTVHIAARTMAAAGPGEVIVTGVVKDLVPGAGFRFDDRGLHQLKGVPGEWRLFALTAVDGQARPATADSEQQRERLESIQPPTLSRRARRPLIGAAAALVLGGIVATVLFGSGRSRHSAAPQNGSSTLAPKGQLLAIDPSTRKSKAPLALDFTPGPIVFAEGSIWIVDESGNRVVRVNSVTSRVEARIAVGKDPVDISVGAGSIWVANHFGRSVTRIDPGTNNVTKTIKVDFRPAQIAANNLAVWVDEVGKIAPSDPYPTVGLTTIESATNRVLDSTRLRAPPDCAASLGAGTSGGWAASAFGQVWKLDARGGPPFVLAQTPQIALAGLLVRDDGTIWFGSDGSPGRVLSLDPSKKKFSDPISVGTTENRGGAGCNRIWLISGGNYLWITNADDHSLSVIAIVSGQGVDTVPLAGEPAGLTSGVDQVWVAVGFP